MLLYRASEVYLSGSAFLREAIFDADYADYADLAQMNADLLHGVQVSHK